MESSFSTIDGQTSAKGQIVNIFVFLDYVVPIKLLNSAITISHRKYVNEQE